MLSFSPQIRTNWNIGPMSDRHETTTNRIAIIVEDPGAANVLADLPGQLLDAGFEAVVFAGPTAESQLDALGCGFRALPVDRDAHALITSLAPQLIITGTSENPAAFGLVLIEAARQRDVPSVSVVDGPANPDRRFRGRGTTPTAYIPDWILVADEWTRDAYAAIGIDRSRIKVVGHPHFDRVIDARQQLDAVGRETLRNRHFSAAASATPVVLFLAEISDGLDSGVFRRSPDYTLEGFGDSDARTDVVLQELIHALRKLPVPASLFVRLHPKNTEHEFSRYTEDLAGFSTGGAALEVVYAADLVVGMTTSLLTEAHLLGRPTLSILPRGVEAEWNPSTRSGDIPVLSHRDEISAAIDAALCPSETVPALPGTQANKAGAARSRLSNSVMALLRQHKKVSA